VHQAPTLEACSSSLIRSVSFLLADSVQATHAQLMVYRSMDPQALHGLPSYFLLPLLAAMFLGDKFKTISFGYGLQILNQTKRRVQDLF
jgi:hypothetical protein